MIKLPHFRRIICGKPVVIINDGTLDQKALKKLRMSTEDLSEQLREKDVFSLEDVAYALVETDGKLSVVKKPDKNTVTAGMLAIAVPDTGICLLYTSPHLQHGEQLCKSGRPAQA